MPQELGLSVPVSLLDVVVHPEVVLQVHLVPAGLEADGTDQVGVRHVDGAEVPGDGAQVEAHLAAAKALALAVRELDDALKARGAQLAAAVVFIDGVVWKSKW